MPTREDEIRFLQSLTDDELRARHPGLTDAGLADIRAGRWVPPFGDPITDEDIAGLES